MNTLFWSLMFVAAHAASPPPAVAPLEGPNLLDSKSIRLSLAEAKKGTAIVFLSAVCPCSNSHVQELRDLARTYPDVQFVAVHSNADEKVADSRRYFEQVKLPFPVLQDDGAKIADRFNALKTPHVFLLKPDGSVVYKGGVSNSHDFVRADRKFFREALEDLQGGKTIRTPEGRTLGCVIARTEND